MNQKTIAANLSQKFGETKKFMESVIEAALGMVSESLSKGEKVRLVGFGNFVVRNRKGRLGRNPRTGERMQIDSSKCPVFIPGSNLKKIVKGK